MLGKSWNDGVAIRRSCYICVRRRTLRPNGQNLRAAPPPTDGKRLCGILKKSGFLGSLPNG